MAYSGSDYRRLIPNRAIFIDTARDHPIDMGQLWEQPAGCGANQTPGPARGRSRMSSDQRTKDYVARRTEEGKPKKEIMRCLKRCVSREIYNQLTNPRPAPVITDIRPTRQQLGITLQTAARHFATWSGTLSRIERGLSRDDALAHEYRSWLTEQNPGKDMS